ncbi:TetR/AcrR family transcriptional regulator [Cecembia calidifontis]|jgi:AcrR family transcriptional regulator|uniref:TetR family transcriptional regulator n=1 Tax=Cecembia calidifontis TaxID=1187080 RepID=A0A4V2F6R9_9BACT|nr:TetR/AcrR family transcriptional regulator [Cecembia calidifontis]RZS97279.1 TetR family transcriptional regulator [Cecembia calidifontis]
MGVAERKIREKEQLRGLILGAARNLFFKHGFEKTSIRNIAEQIEYSPGIIYHYFKDKNEIFHALHQEGFQNLKHKMESVMNIADPMGRLKAMGKNYVLFALENPVIYDLMFTLKAPMEHILEEEDKSWKEGETVFEMLKKNVRECMLNGYFRGQTADATTYTIWATLHGLVSLKIRERSGLLKINETENLVMNSFQAFSYMLDRQ